MSTTKQTPEPRWIMSKSKSVGVDFAAKKILIARNGEKIVAGPDGLRFRRKKQL